MLFFRAVLLFCKPHPRSFTEFQADPRDGLEIVAELRRAGINNAVLNACESGSNAYNDVNTNLAQIFLERGLSFVFAMSNKVLEGAVEIFTERFYYSLLQDQLDIAQAAEAARYALLQDQGRRALFSDNVKIEDFLNLVIYRHADTLLFQLHQDTTTVIQEPPDLEIASRFLTHNQLSLFQRDLIGRDTQITELETLADALKQKIIILYGQVGCGKTALLRYCEWWWVNTGYVDAALYLDKTMMTESEFSMSYLLQEISRVLKIECTDPNIEIIARLLKKRRVLIILDGLERGNYQLSKRDQLALKDFIAKASQGKSIFILSTRNRMTWEADDFVDLEYVAAYRLPTLSIRDAIQFTEHLARHTQQGSRETKLRGKEALTYLERVVILLDQNPLAIEAVCSPEGVLEDPKALFWSLLAADDRLDGKSILSPTFWSLAMKILSWKLQNDSDKDPMQAFYSPETLALFWNVFPKDLRYFYYFICIQFLNDSENAVAHTKKPLLAFTYESNRDLALRSVQNLGYSTYLPRTIDFLLSLGLLEDAMIQESDGQTHEAYHLTPVAKLLFQKDLTESLAPTLRSAFVKSSILRNGRYQDQKQRHIVGVFWDGQKQHPDHTVNLSLSATIFSLASDISEEITQHGESFTDALMGDLILRNWGDARSADLGNLIAKIHLLRLVWYMKTNPKGPDSNSLLRLATIANGLVEGGDPDGEGAVKAFFDLYPLWLQKGERISPIMEARCFDLRYAEAICVRNNKGSIAAKDLFERNLQIDPEYTPVDHSLYGADRRIQVKNLQEWVMGVNELAKIRGDDSLQNKELMDEHMPAILSDCAPGTFFETVKKLMPSLDSINPTYGEWYHNIIEREGEAVKKFGALAHQILNEPMAQNYSEFLPEPTFKAMMTIFDMSNETVSGVVGDRTQKQAMFDVMTDIETVFRLQARDWAGAKVLLHRKIARETSNLSTAWRTLGDVHLDLHNIAIEEGDWETAKHHLDKRWGLFEGNHHTDPAFSAEFHMGYARVMDALEEPVEAGRCLLQANEDINRMGDEKLEYQCQRMAFRLSNLNLLLASSESGDGDAKQVEGGLSSDEVKVLKAMAAEAKEYEEALEEADRIEKKYAPLLEFAKTVLKTLGPPSAEEVAEAENDWKLSPSN